MPRKISSHDVARYAGVSQSTVSLVLNGRAEARIPEATRQRVLDAARSLNYTRNAAARALVTGRTHRIGIVANHPYSLRNRDDSYYGDIVAGVTDSAIRLNYNLLFHTAGYANWQALLADIRSGSADGILLVGRPYDDELTAALQAAQFPLVCISYRPCQEPFHAVDCENAEGIRLAVAYLTTLGHRHLAFLTQTDDASWCEERRDAALQAGRELAHASGSVVVSSVGYDALVSFEERPARLADWLRSQSPIPTALIFSDEHFAQLAAEAFPELGFRVPEEISIISFNSTQASERTRPPLTSIYQPLVEIGQAAADTLVALIEKREAAPGVQRFPVRLDIRQSCAPLKIP